MRIRLWMLAALVTSLSSAALAAGESVLTYHSSMDRHGAYTVPSLTLSNAAKIHLDKNFKATVSGNVYAQPLFWKPDGATKGLVIVATESNIVYALDENSGAEVWHTTLAHSVPRKNLPCGNIDPSGITGTPVIDPSNGTIYFDALVTGPRHMIYALSVTDGNIISHWPIDVQSRLSASGVSFSPSTQGERSALLFFDGNLYVNYGGNDGDCGTYHGTVIQIDPKKHKIVASWQTRALGGGIWAQGGMAGDGAGLFATTGNTMQANVWGDGEAIIRLRAGLVHSFDSKDHFTPTNWRMLDDQDLDLGGTEAIPINIARGSTTQQDVIAFGKDGNAYLADRTNLGGVGGELARAHVSNHSIITAPAVYQTASRSMIAFTNSGSDHCPSGNITMLDIGATGKHPIRFAWCEALNGRGSPIITTTDGSADAIVWVAGAEG